VRMAGSAVPGRRWGGGGGAGGGQQGASRLRAESIHLSMRVVNYFTEQAAELGTCATHATVLCVDICRQSRGSRTLTEPWHI